MVWARVLCVQEGWTKGWKVGGGGACSSLPGPCLSESLTAIYGGENRISRGEAGAKTQQISDQVGSGRSSQTGAERADIVTVSDRRQMRLGRVAPAWVPCWSQHREILVPRLPLVASALHRALDSTTHPPH